MGQFTYPQVLVWAVVAGTVSAAIDLDVVTLILLNASRHPPLRRFLNPLNIFTQFKLFMQTITETGLLKTAMKSHIAIFFLLVILTRLFWPAWLLPVTVAVVTHLLSDIPNIRKAVAW